TIPGVKQFFLVQGSRLQSNDPRHNDRAVVVGGAGLGKGGDSAENGVEKCLGLEGAVFKFPVEAFSAEEFAAGVAGFGNSIGVEDDLVALLQLLLGLTVTGVGENTERQSADAIERQQRTVLAALDARRIVAGAGVGEHATAWIVDAVEPGD